LRQKPILPSRFLLKKRNAFGFLANEKMDSRARNFSYKVPKESLALKARGIACIPLLGILFLLGSGNHALANQANYSLLIKGGGSLHAMGFNVNGQLGTRNTTSKNSPTQIVASGDGGYNSGDYRVRNFGFLFNPRLSICGCRS
jgi:hypothetical protein